MHPAPGLFGDPGAAGPSLPHHCLVQEAAPEPEGKAWGLRGAGSLGLRHCWSFMRRVTAQPQPCQRRKRAAFLSQLSLRDVLGDSSKVTLNPSKVTLNPSTALTLSHRE